MSECPHSIAKRSHCLICDTQDTTIAAVVAWLEREATNCILAATVLDIQSSARDDMAHKFYAVRELATRLKIYPQVLDQPTAQEGK